MYYHLCTSNLLGTKEEGFLQTKRAIELKKKKKNSKIGSDEVQFANETK